MHFQFYFFSFFKTGLCFALAILLHLFSSVFVHRVISSENSEIQDDKVAFKRLSIFSGFVALFFSAVFLISRIFLDEKDPQDLLSQIVLFIFLLICQIGIPFLYINGNKNLKNYMKEKYSFDLYSVSV